MNLVRAMVIKNYSRVRKKQLDDVFKREGVKIAAFDSKQFWQLNAETLSKFLTGKKKERKKLKAYSTNRNKINNNKTNANSYD